MNPIKNKKDLETTIEDIKNFAYAYLEKYNPSKQQLRTYLFKKFIKNRQTSFNKKELFNLIDEVVLNLVDKQLLNDKYYSDAKSRVFLKRGYFKADLIRNIEVGSAYLRKQENYLLRERR